MVNTASLVTRLKADLADAAEFQSVLLDYYSRSTYLADRKIGYGREEGVAALIVAFTKAGHVAGISPGPAFIEEEIDTIALLVQTQLIDEAPTAIGRRIMFASLPLEGCFKYQDRFQILPVPPEAPRPQFAVDGHPFQLEVAFKDTTAVSVRMRRLMRAAHEVELLCGALLGPGVHATSNQTRFHWVIDNYEGEPAYSYRQEGYSWPGMKGIWADGFSSLDGLSAAPMLPAQAYYTTNSIRIGEPLSLPDTLTKSLDTFFTLPRKEREQFLAACYWYEQSSRIRSISGSASFVALVSAIEALTSIPESTICLTCGQNKGSGPTQLFAEFIEKFVPDSSATPATRKALYRLRSQITHGDKILLSDRAEWIGGFVYSQERSESLRLSAAVRIALINWLLSRPSKS